MKKGKVVEAVTHTHTHTHTHTNKKEKGITLIALIITVILLLILAGVAINFALGDNGILKGAEYATDKYKNKAEQEQNELAKIDDYIQNGRETVTISKEEYDILKNSNSYSEHETIIGTWTDGKPIYRNMITQASLPKNQHITIDVTNLNIDTPIDIKLCCKYNSINFTFFGSPINGSSYSVGAALNQTYIEYYINNWASNLTDGKFIIEYTKTTD